MLFVESVGRGAQKAEDECKFQFLWDRWNCQGVHFTKQRVQIKGKLTLAETAYLKFNSKPICVGVWVA